MAAPAYETSGSGGTTTTTSPTIPKPASLANGNVLYAVVCNGGANAEPSSVPSGWTLTDSAGISTTFWAGVYEKVITDAGSEPANYTWSGFTDSCAGAMIRVSGNDTTTPTHVKRAQANTNSNVACDSITTTVADCLIIAAVGVDDNQCVTDASWVCVTNPMALTERVEVLSSGGADTAVAMATAAQTATGATGNLTALLAGTRDNISFLVAVQPPQSGGSTNANAEAAIGTGTSNAPAPGVAPSAPADTGTAAANDPTTRVAPTPTTAAGTATAETPQAAVSPAATAATATATANDATVLSGTLAHPDSADATGTAHTPTAAVAPSAASASGTAAALDGAASVAPATSAASGSAPAGDPGVTVAPAAAAAAGTGTAGQPTAAVAPAAGAASATGAAHHPTVTAGTRADAAVAAATGAAYDATVVAVSGEPEQVVAATGSWYGLLDITREAASIAAAERSRPPSACPNDGEPLQSHRGVLHCAYDGFTWEG